jgi:molybdopterin/thiamine biosynthesis adenylyltransferase
MSRYERHGLIDWFDQDLVRKSRVVVIGAGAIGNEVLKGLSLLGVGNISVYDFDRIEDHNLTRCVLFRDSDVGKHKAEVAAAACRQIDPAITVKAHCADYWDALRLDELADADMAVCCVDNFEARKGISQLCMMVATDLCNTGIDSRHASAELFPYSSDPECACIECGWPDSVYDQIQRRYSCGLLQRAAAEHGKIPTTAVTSSIAGAMAVSMVLNRLNRHPDSPRSAVRCFMDTIALRCTTSELVRRPDCLGCDQHPRGVARATARRTCASSPLIECAAGDGLEILLSEPVIVQSRCALCGRRQEHLETARRMNDSVTLCTACGDRSVSVTHVQRMTLPDFERTFAGKPVPCKFLTCVTGNTPLIIELEN